MTMASSRFSWGAGLVAAIAVFIAGILVMVWMSVSERVDLVSDHYYDEGLRYQDRIRARERARADSGGVMVTLAGSALRLQFPRFTAHRELSGRIVLYRPDHSGRDSSVAVAPDTLLMQMIPVAGLWPGLWRIKVYWTVDGVEYYNEQPIMIP